MLERMALWTRCLTFLRLLDARLGVSRKEDKLGRCGDKEDVDSLDGEAVKMKTMTKNFPKEVGEEGRMDREDSSVGGRLDRVAGMIQSTDSQHKTRSTLLGLADLTGDKKGEDMARLGRGKDESWAEMGKEPYLE
jgi:hypothetical protein